LKSGLFEDQKVEIGFVVVAAGVARLCSAVGVDEVSFASVDCTPVAV
jgi:hypothetical protein